MMSEFLLNSKEFFKALAVGELIGSRCTQCHALAIPQRPICPKCHSNHTEVINFSGDGKLVAYTVISVPPVMMAEAGYSANNPYCVGIIELSEGPRISAQILDVDMNQPENIKIGTAMKMTTISRGEDEKKAAYLAFKPK
jgi:uncharacterized OB-fold protein